MNTLQNLLVILDGQHLLPGYLTPAGSGTALETVIALMNGFNMWVRYQNPLLNHTPLLVPAWVSSLAAGKDAIYLKGVDGYLDLSHPGTPPQPAYIFG